MDTKLLRQKILDLAIRGKLVPQDPNDEPASVLLERINAEKERLIKEGKIKRSKKTATTSDSRHYPFELPSGWVWCTLDSLCSIKGGKRIPKGYTFASTKTNHIYLRVSDMKYNTIILDDLKYIDDEVYSQIKNYTINKSDLYLTIAGTIGSVGIIPEEVDGMSLTENAAKLTDILCVKEYLLYALQSTVAKDHFSFKYHQVAQPKLSIETASKTPIPLPPYQEQFRIVAEIKHWLSLIERIESTKKDLQIIVSQAKNKILDLAIHGKLVPQDPSDEPAIELLKRINPKFTPCDNEHDTNQLPDSWCWTTFGDVCELVTGSTPSKLHPEYYGGDFPFYKPTDLDAGRHVNIPSEFLTDEGKNVSRIIPVGSTAICCIGSIGKCGYIEKEGTTNQQINTAVPSKSLSPLYLYYFCNSSYFIDELSADSSAITISIVNKSKLSKMLISLPPYNEQLRIVAKIEELFAQLDAIENSLQA